MKILMVTVDFLGRESGGIAQYVYNLSKQLVTEGHEVEIITYIDDIEVKRHIEKHNIKVHNLKIKPCDYLSQLKFAYYASRLIKRLIENGNNYDIVHSHETSSFPFSLFYNSDPPLVVTYHGKAFLYKQPEGSILKRKLRFWINVLQIKRAHKIIVLNYKNFEDAINLGFGEKVTLIPNMIDLNEFRNNEKTHSGFLMKLREDLKVKSDNLVLLYVGRLAPMKGLEVLLESIMYIKNNYRDIYDNIKLLIVGDGPLFDLLINIKNKYELNNIVFLGWLDHSELVNICKIADVFVFPSLGEGMPTVILEAMAAGLPIICSKIPGIEDIVKEDFGLFVKPGDSMSLVNAIVKMFEDRTMLLRMKRAAIKDSNKYSLDRILKKVLDVYNDTITCTKY